MRFTSTRRFWIRWTTVLAVGILFIPGMRLMGRQKRRAHHTRRVVHRRRRVIRHSRIRHYRRGYYFYHHDAYLAHEIKPERVKQIQQALVTAGDLHEDPTGRWDTATQKAMRQYQIQNGFAPTGLPEAKPLMKLGLGPHPLPPALDRATAANAKAQADTGTSVASDSLPAKKSSSTSTQ